MFVSEVQHQARARRVMERAIVGGRIPHAYIFHGPDGVGKEMFARDLARFLLCANARSGAKPAMADPVPAGGDTGAFDLFSLQPDPQPSAPAQKATASEDTRDASLSACGRCDDCRMIAGDTHPDWHLVYRQLNRAHPDPEVRKRKGLDIGVDVLRSFVIDRVGFTPIRGRAKVFVIREADRITTQAQNALLKTLEEPPGTTYLILLVTAMDRLLPTTLSRCQVMEFDPLPFEFVRERLRAGSPRTPPSEIDWCARFGDGSLGAAMQAVEEGLFAANTRIGDTLLPQRDGRGTDPREDLGGLFLTERARCLKCWTDEAQSLGERYRKRDPDISDTEATRRGWKTVFRLMAEAYANALRVRAERPGADASVASDHVGSERAADAIQRIALAERHLDHNANTQLVVEVLANDLARIAVGEPVSAGGG